jgi:hypothetical protein
MSFASSRFASSVSPASPPADPGHVDPGHVDRGHSDRGGSNPTGPKEGPPPARRRGRGRTQRGLVRPRCPEHGGEMLVGRTVGSVQYRYCTVEGCPCATTTFRSDAPHKRWPPPAHAPGSARARGRVADPGADNPGRSAGELPAEVTIVPQPSPVAPTERPMGRTLPGQSS